MVSTPGALFAAWIASRSEQSPERQPPGAGSSNRVTIKSEFTACGPSASAGVWQNTQQVSTKIRAILLETFMLVQSHGVMLTSGVLVGPGVLVMVGVFEGVGVLDGRGVFEGV